MPFIGNQPALSYTSFAKQDFTTSATTSYTLDYPVTNENELALFINFVRQEPTTAYTASGTTLTLTSATSASDDMYCVFLGKAVQTVNPPSGSVGTAQIADLAVTSGKLASGVLPNNTPAFQAYRSSGQSISTSTFTKIQFNAELFDTDSAYDSSTNYRFTPQTAGKYFVYALLRSTSINSVFASQQQTNLRKNGSDITGVQGAEIYDFYNGANLDLTIGMAVTGVVELNGSTDYVECFHQSNAGSPWVSGTFGAYKIIGA